MQIQTKSSVELLILARGQTGNIWAKKKAGIGEVETAG
jgi:hypothetical protein